MSEEKIIGKGTWIDKLAADLTSQYEKGTLKLTRGMKAEEALEAYIVNELGKARVKSAIPISQLNSRGLRNAPVKKTLIK